MSAVQNWVQKADLQPLDGANQDPVAIDETVIQLGDEQYWLYTAVDPATNRLLYVRLYSTRNTVVSSMFMPALREKHHVDDALFLFDGAPWFKAACHHHILRFRHGTHGNRNSIEGVLRKVKRRINQFGNCFSHTEVETVEKGLQAFGFAWNQLI